MLISIVVAVAKNGVIGKDNQLLWKLSDDLKRFKAITTGHCIIMGRKTFDSIGKALPNRTNIIISRNKKIAYEQTIIFQSLNESLAYAESLGEKEVFIIGGGEIYKQALPKANRIYLTEVDVSINGDTYFYYDKKDWQILENNPTFKNEKNEYDARFLLLERK